MSDLLGNGYNIGPNPGWGMPQAYDNPASIGGVNNSGGSPSFPSAQYGNSSIGYGWGMPTQPQQDASQQSMSAPFDYGPNSGWGSPNSNGGVQNKLMDSAQWGVPSWDMSGVSGWNGSSYAPPTQNKLMQGANYQGMY